MSKSKVYNIDTGVFDGGDLTLPSHLNFSKVYMEMLKRYGNKIAFIDGVTGEEITFKHFVQQVLNVAASLASLGVKCGDVVAICSENKIEFMVTVFATIYIGAIANFINCAYSKDEFIHTTNISKPKYMFFSPTAYKTYHKFINELRFLQKCFIYGERTTNATSFADLVKNNVDGSKFQPADIKGTQTAIIVYSSGTTGLPKGAKWTHLNLIIAALQDTCTEDDLVALNIAPFSNTVGYILTTDMLNKGKTIVFLTKFNEKLYLQTIQKYKVGLLIAVPPLLIVLSKSPMVEQFNLQSIKLIMCGGAPLESKVIVEVKKRLKNLRHVLQGYGMTEATGALSMEFEKQNKIGSVGVVVPGVKLKVVDIESRKVLGPNQVGEVLLGGSALFGGYIGTDTSSYYEDGFYKTGDVAFYDEDGFFYIVDRIKELIKYNTWQVSPSEIEATLIQHPAVKDAGVIGIPDPSSGELPFAFVVKQPGANVTEKEIIEFVASKMSRWKQLRGGVRFVKEIPKNGSGKILRRQLREMLAKPASKL